MDIEQKISLQFMDTGSIDDVAEIYKKVFSGHPWHEDLVCSNILNLKDDSTPVCSAQYTSSRCNMYDSRGGSSNDCRNDYSLREGIHLLPPEGLERCLDCKDVLSLIKFYPEYRNHLDLIVESLEKEGFSGFIGRDGPSSTIGFSWGYRVPPKRTISVDFPLWEKFFNEQGVNVSDAFYAAETGVVGSLQDKGIGSVLSAARTFHAHKHHKPAILVTRTINPSVHSYLTRIFSGNKPELLFKDPSASGSVFACNFRDLDENYISERLTSGVINPELVLD